MASSYQPIPPKIRVLPTVLNFMDGSRLHMKPQNSRNRSKNDIFDLLRRAVNQNLRVEVLTRDCRGIDGLLVGWLIAFDKHMNMVMSDVDQVFRRLTDGQDYLELGARRQDPVVERRKLNSEMTIYSKICIFSTYYHNRRAKSYDNDKQNQ